MRYRGLSALLSNLSKARLDVSSAGQGACIPEEGVGVPGDRDSIGAEGGQGAISWKVTAVSFSTAVRRLHSVSKRTSGRSRLS